MKITRKEYTSKPAEYRGLVDGVPYLLYLDEAGRTVYGPVEIIQETTPSTLFTDKKVEALSVEDFLNRYYRPERYIGRGREYAAALLKSHQEDFEKYGYDIISRHDSVTGSVVAYFG